jgi:putative glycosyltransferase (TIGR04372 family)
LYEIKEEVFAQGEISPLNPIIELDQGYKDRARAYLESRGLPPNSWFVSLHIRNEGFGIARRNQPIESFMEAINYITEQGGWVVRIGDTTMKPMNVMDHVIDLAIDKNSRFVHPYVMQQALFHVGTCSGPTWAAAVLGTPVLMTNTTSIARNAHSMSVGSLFLPKRVIYKSRELTLSEILSHTEGYSEMETYDLHKSGIELLPNTSVEIKDAVQEIMHWTRNPTVALSEIDMKTNEIRKEIGAVGFGKFSNSFIVNNPKWLI